MEGTVIALSATEVLATVVDLLVAGARGHGRHTGPPPGSLSQQ